MSVQSLDISRRRFVASAGLAATAVCLVPHRLFGAEQNLVAGARASGAKAGYDGIVAFSQTDFTEDLKKINVPVLVMHSEDDQIVPYQAAGPLSAKLLKKGTLKTYEDLPHGMITTHADIINADLLAFIKG